jgi:hypothetical protein
MQTGELYRCLQSCAAPVMHLRLVAMEVGFWQVIGVDWCTSGAWQVVMQLEHHLPLEKL